jgi:hypothetical protein
MHAISLFLLLLISIQIHGQETRQIHCRFLGFGGNGEPATVIAPAAKGGDVICPLPSTRISPKVVCSATNNTIGFLSVTNRNPFASASIPASVHTVLLVFIRTPRKPEVESVPSEWRVWVIEDSEKNFPDGGAYVANFYNKDIRFVLGEHKGMLHAAGAHGYSMPKNRDDFNMAPVIFEFQQGESWCNANESALRFLPGIRYLIFAHVDAVSGRPRINTYQDVVQAAPERTKTGTALEISRPHR